MPSANEKKFPCPECGDMFKYESGLSYHMKKRHPLPDIDPAEKAGLPPLEDAIIQAAARDPSKCPLGEPPRHLCDETCRLAVRPADMDAVKAVVAVVKTGVPIETACDMFKIDKVAFDRLIREGDMTRRGFPGQAATLVRQAEAEFVANKISKMMNGSPADAKVAQTYLETFRPRYAQASKLRLSYEIMGILNAVKDALGVETARQVAEVISNIDPHAVMLAQDAYLLPSG